MKTYQKKELIQRLRNTHEQLIKVKAEEQKSYKNYYDKTHKNIEFSKNE